MITIMDNDKKDIKAATEAAPDRGENVALMEPLLLSEDSRHRARLTDLVTRHHEGAR